MEDPLPEWVRREADLVSQPTAYRAVHRPDTEDEVSAGRGPDAVRRGVRAAAGDGPASRPGGGGRSRASAPGEPVACSDAFDARLPFALTEGQREISDQLFADLARPHPMQRLLQGEVGSGKTVVALRAMLTVVDNGGQAALLAPDRGARRPAPPDDHRDAG